MDSYFQVRDAERTAWFTSQEVRNIADVAAMVTKALDAAGGEGGTSVQALADHGGISLRPISADRFSSQVRDLFCEPPGKLLAELDLKLRGAGDVNGTLQSGMAFDLKIANPTLDSQILTVTREAAAEVLTADPTLAQNGHEGLRELRKRYSGREEIDFSQIS